MKSRITPAILLVLLLLLTVAAMYDLMRLRFSQGDVYPPYSSLRSDPLGTRVLFDSLSHLHGVEVSRNYRQNQHLMLETNAVVFVIGLESAGLHRQPKGEIQDMDRMLASGQRLLFALYPQRDQSFLQKWDEELKEEDKKKEEEKEKKGAASEAKDSVKKESDEKKMVKKEASSPEKKPSEKKRLEGEEMKRHFVSPEEHWNFKVEFDVPLARDESEPGQLYAKLDGTVDSNPVTWKSHLYFKNLSPAWKVIRKCGDKAVVIERSFGAGTLVLMSDSYFLSNEAMRSDRHPEFLAWLVGEKRKIIFDETHLGVQESPGVATLIRKYHLEGFCGGLLLLAILFIWKNASPLVPALTLSHGEESPQASGRDDLSGLVNLLRRNISFPGILKTCMSEWKRARGKHFHGKTETIENAVNVAEREAAAGIRGAKPVENYNIISQMLNERN